MRIITLAAKYKAHLGQFAQTHPGIDRRPYSCQLEQFLKDSFGAPENRTHAFESIGYECAHVIANAESMQKQWARENGVAADSQNWLLDIVSAQVRSFRPDVLFFTDYNIFPAHFLRRLKAETPAIRLTLGWCGAPYNDPAVFKEYDRVLSNVPELVGHFTRQGHAVHHVDHAFDARILKQLEPAPGARIDFSFVGSIFKGEAYHDARAALIAELMDRTPLQVWGQVRKPPLRKQARLRARRLAFDLGGQLRAAGISENLLARLPVVGKAISRKKAPALKGFVAPSIWQRTHPPVFGLAMFQKLHDSRLTLNSHIGISTDSASNMRLFEATGVGACLLTDWKENLAALFEPDAEVVTYRSVEECVEKARYLLDHDAERRSIAAAGQNRTLRDHNILQRVSQIDEIIREHLRAAQPR